MAARVDSAAFEEEVLRSGLPVLADFYSDSCMPCKALSPVLSRIEKQFEGRLKAVTININFDTELAERYDVQSVPTLIIFRSGEEAERIHGLVSAEVLAETLEKIL